jgi:colicin import membrane protein
MRPPEFDDISIIGAGEALEAAGRRVTQTAIRDRLRGGNVGRIRRVWEAHVAFRAEMNAGPAAGLMEALQNEMDGAATALIGDLRGFLTRLVNEGEAVIARRVAAPNADVPTHARAEIYDDNDDL